MRFGEGGVSIFCFAIAPHWDGIRRSKGEASILFLQPQALQDVQMQQQGMSELGFC